MLKFLFLILFFFAKSLLLPNSCQAFMVWATEPNQLDCGKCSLQELAERILLRGGKRGEVKIASKTRYPQREKQIEYLLSPYSGSKGMKERKGGRYFEKCIFFFF
eukprot:TRINITY_DN5473_c0_g2_i1.p1 TRINITY_DN5473_c0_g2~~TRINITY_DN5473_c0_g2_i1.p1  ORF type:complete len:105 (-),score=0.93 TRINITY_DN5473_c0_g2_i1:116-430(-)